MTDAQMLEALYNKAKDNDWSDEPWWSGAHVAFDDAGFEASGDWYSCMGILFRHSFARALFGEETTVVVCKQAYHRGGHTFELLGGMVTIDGDGGATFVMTFRSFEYHIQMAIISPNPIKYLYEAVFPEAVDLVHQHTEKQKDAVLGHYGEAVFE